MEILKVLRDRRGLSQARLAARADMNPVTVWRIETGQRSPTVEQLERLADAMDLEVADFFPKAQVPLPLDIRDRTVGEVVAETIALWSGGWLERIDKEWDELDHYDQQLLVGRAYAAIELRDALLDGFNQINILDLQEKEELAEVIRILDLVVSQVLNKLKVDNAEIGGAWKN
jgi:transcriptional regulator with XRE-family HTH domain